MNKEELKTIVAQMLRELHTGEHPEPMVKAGDYKPTQNRPTEDGGVIADITTVDLRKQYLVENPKNAAAFMALKAKTPARLGVGRAGTRYKTATLLRFRADHAAAQDSVFSLVPEDFAKANGLIPVKTECRDKDEYLTRPDLGRRFDEQNQIVIRETCANQRVLLVIGDGLSSAAIEANAIDCASAIRQGLKSYGIELGKSLFIKFCRVGASDHIGDLTGCELVCMLVGERPGLVTNESMSAYITYRPHRGISESKRTVVSNIHRQGVSAVEAGAHIASLIDKMLKQKASGIDLVQEVTA
ncbi:MAG: ethanolamine ammonia-lyase subunit EutC [Faecousia sp.]